MKNFNAPVLSAMFSLLWTLLLCSVLCIYSCWLLLFLAATFVMTSFKCQPTWNAKWNNFCRVAEAKEEGEAAGAAGAGALCNNKLSYELAYDFHFENQHTHTHSLSNQRALIQQHSNTRSGKSGNGWDGNVVAICESRDQSQSRSGTAFTHKVWACCWVHILVQDPPSATPQATNPLCPTILRPQMFAFLHISPVSLC